MERLAVYCAGEEQIARVREGFEKHGIAAHYTADAEDAAKYPAIAPAGGGLCGKGLRRGLGSPRGAL